MTIVLLASLFSGCVTRNELKTANQRLAKTYAAIEEIKKGPKVEDPGSAWYCGPKPTDRIYNLPNGESVEMIGIPCGSFVMGNPEVIFLGEAIGHKVTLTEPFWIAKFPLTFAQSRFLLPDSEGKKLFAETPFDKCDPDWPDFCLTWEDAQRIAEAMNRLFGDTLPQGYHFSLPTEAQWEYACRAGTVGAYNNGKDATVVKEPFTTKRGTKVEVPTYANACPNLDEVGWYSGHSGLKLHKVGMKKPNAWGIYDMHGLCGEWCSDYYSKHIEETSINIINPRGPSHGVAHVIRGGGIGYLPLWCTSYHRSKLGVYPKNSKLKSKLWGKPACTGMRLAIVKDAQEAVDTSDLKLYGKSPKTVYKWQEEQIKVLKAENDKAFEPIRRKAKLLPVAKFAMTTYEILKPAIEVYVDEQIEKAVNKAFGVKNGAVGAGNAGGYGMIRGPSSLGRGNTGTYVLYVGGRKISSGVSWSQNGTSISVYGSGGNARAQAGNPPIKSGRYRTGIKASYNGRTYCKTVYIVK